jgi:hypothetical protein
MCPLRPHRLAVERRVERPWIADAVVARGMGRGLLRGQAARDPQRGLSPQPAAEARDRRESGGGQVGSPAA